MRAIDTNVVLRLLVRDDSAQTLRAESFVASGAWVSHLVLAETVGMLTTVYHQNAAEVGSAIEMLLNHKCIGIQDAEVVTDALQRFRDRPSLGFSDCLILEIARKAGHVPLGTFDRALAKLEGVQRIS